MPLIDRNARGRCLDIGSGHSPYKKRLVNLGGRVVSIDVENRAGQVDLIGDIQNMQMIRDESFNTILCTQVLEHVPRPWDAISEIQRVLKQDGHVIISVPHLSAIHEAPHDYFRYTEYGLQEMFRTQGLEILELYRAGGMLCFLTHYATVVLLSLVAPIPGVNRLAVLLNYVLMVRLLEPLDRWFGLPKIFPCNYVVLAGKETHLHSQRPSDTRDSSKARRPASA